MYHPEYFILNLQMAKFYIMIHSNKHSNFTSILGQIWTNPAIGLHILFTFFNPTFGFVHILPKIGLKQPRVQY